jgi:putative endonuclease
VYIVRCCNGDLYTGYTIDPVRRLEQHNQGKASKFTRSRLPVELVYLERFGTRSEALRREISIKQLSRKEKLKIISAKERRLPKWGANKL